ncbi:polyprenyl synthetase family protein [Cryomorpha ignava]|uniref:Polyprenyl synthetase family protein n=1 Tax=Cryomorpha ignava TaxID=101383 RepID=A0A7K3WK43_9FLAO|nr:polyprenyl synthetase family protein [Cryomorpha ignava]NEN21908.1 polyprenyl synthetase family protein [Cryomorpha ignava]
MTQHLDALQNKFEAALLNYAGSLPDNSLHQPIRYILALGGKRIRPALVLLSGKAFGAAEGQLIRTALAVEIFHNFSLVHDDIMDKAPLRRGKATVHEKWDSNAAILSGDAMLIEAYKQLSLCGHDHLKAILDLFNTTSLQVCEGQQLDMDFESRTNVSVSEYIEMIRLKTAVLLGCSLKMGALLGNASEDDCKHIYNFGKLCGIAFQIQDDYLDAFGNPQDFGKQVGGDILSNKKTYLIIKALELASADVQAELESIYFQNTISDGDKKVSRVLKLFRELKIDEITKDESLRYFQLAKAEIDNTSLNDSQKEGFLEFLEMLQGRRK